MTARHYVALILLAITLIGAVAIGAFVRDATDNMQAITTQDGG